MFVNGSVLTIIGLPLILIEMLNEGAEAPFLEAFACIMFFGIGFILVSRGAEMSFSRKQLFILTVSVWVTLTAAATLPFWLWGIPLTDAVFEAASGITTTGATVLSNLDDMPHSILMWRAFLQWLGGIGIVVMAIAILPFLKIGGMQLFQTESSERTDDELPSAAKLASVTIWVYLAMTILCIAAFLIGGMSLFDAVAHTFATVSTGGFSTHDQSFGYFDSDFVKWSCVVFMFAGSVPFIWYIRAVRKGQFASEQLWVYGAGLLIVIASVAIWLVMERQESVADASLLAAFSVVSVVTTSGFAIEDYSGWSGFSALFFFLLIMTGGCTGSTSGGIKVMRFVVSGKMIRQIISRSVFPSGVFTAKYEGKVISGEVFGSVAGFMFIYMVTFLFFAFILALSGLDLMTSLSGSAAALANEGAGIGPIIGPSGNYGSLTSFVKWALAFEMILGRLEIFTLLVFLTPRFWRS
ncbi:Trk system potassium uptake protein [Sneathiella chinensis]|uniref:Trk system potassium uptake protein n=1 Tax=Sneathiella chinensis TaxID=349750 RepID=A0ABQ5U698_9PROT|nr:Trk system potassium uptake protein [Sneathiella chinensis]